MRIFEDQVFEKKDVIEIGSYEGCSFIGCNLNNTDISARKFVNCVFEECDLSLAKVNHTFFQEVEFLNCKLLGIRFSECNTFGFSIRVAGGMLDHSLFYKLNVKNSSFEDVQLQEVDFTEADLSGIRFTNCNLIGAIFEYTNLEKCDFRTAYGFSIDPDKNKVKKAKFSIDGLPGLLDKYDIEILP